VAVVTTLLRNVAELLDRLADAIDRRWKGRG
jgi:hypothetical protein